MAKAAIKKKAKVGKAAVKKAASKKTAPSKAAVKAAKATKKKSAGAPKKASAKKPASGAGGGAPATVAKDGLPRVRVRMFRQGLGDCFVLTFNYGGDERHMLIDFGSLGNKSTDASMADIGDAIVETVGKQGRIHVVVATHEHWDHLSGFNTAAMQSLPGKVDHVWLAWTEDPKDPDAQAFAKNKKDLGKALAAVAESAPGHPVAEHVASMLGFAMGDTPLGAAKFAESVNDAMQFVRTGLGVDASYHEPGQLIEESWLPGFRFYVLGPPRDKGRLGELGSHSRRSTMTIEKSSSLPNEPPDDFVKRFNASQNRLYGFVVTLVPLRDDAEDVFQQTCLILWQKWREYDRTREFVPWACGIAFNVVRNFRRASKRQPLPLDDDVLELAAREWERTEPWLDARRTALPDCIGKLSLEQQEILRACYLGEDSIKCVAEQNATTAGALYMKLQRIRRQLMACLDAAVGSER
jgi:RNA polymerase sigma-70 factor